MPLLLKKEWRGFALTLFSRKAHRLIFPDIPITYFVYHFTDKSFL